MAVVLVWTLPLDAAQSQVAWLRDRALQTCLTEPVGVEWSGVPLREALVNLARTKQVALFLDRRVDPDQELEVSLADVPLGEVFRQVAENRGYAVSLFGPVVYLGPPSFTSRLRTLAALRLEEVRRLPAEVARPFVRVERLRWDDFAEPRELLRELARENGLELAGLEQVPHDLWAAADLPPLSLVDRLTLLAGQFDLTFRIAPDGKRVTLVPVPEKVGLVRNYPAGRRAEERMAKWAALLPDCRIERVGAQIVVEGLLEDHERLVAGNRPEPRIPKPVDDDGDLARKRFTVRQANGPLIGILEELAQRLDLELKIDREALDRAGISLHQTVTFSVEDATLDELLEAVLAPAGCTFRRRGSTVEVRP